MEKKSRNLRDKGLGGRYQGPEIRGQRSGARDWGLEIGKNLSHNYDKDENS
jgi:hypothetical protein